MNIFVLDKDPIVAAQLQCDRHVVKMTTESAQMLSTAHRLLDGAPIKRPSKSGKTIRTYYCLYEGADDLEAEMLYMANVHEKHPCTIWTMESEANYRWHWEHLRALSEEYTYRYGRTHKVGVKLLWGLESPPRNIPKGPMTQFKLAMKDQPQCMHPNDPVRSYKEFYHTKQQRFKMAWTKRNIPEWFNASIYA